MESLSPETHRPEVLTIEKVVEETSNIKSFYVNSPELSSRSDPGQFIMVWVIGTDEVPMAVSTATEDGTVGFTVEDVGEATSELHNLEEGDLLGVRGPYGNGFDLTNDNLLIVGGGCGMAPLIFAVEEAVNRGKNVEVILTAETEGDLLFRSKLENMGIELTIGTEDGSAGVKGVTPDVIEETVIEWEYDSCLICGPEKMMIATCELIERKQIPMQVSLNRYIKCGIGLCGSCSIDPSGLRVCVEGPVFKYNEIKDSEFGDYKRDAAGKILKV